MYIIYRIIGIVAFGLATYFTYQMNEKAISKGNYIQSNYNGKFTIWSLPCYFSFIMLAVFIATLFM